jgi:hypothetical protein
VPSLLRNHGGLPELAAGTGRYETAQGTLGNSKQALDNLLEVLESGSFDAGLWRIQLHQRIDALCEALASERGWGQPVLEALDDEEWMASIQPDAELAQWGAEPPVTRSTHDGPWVRNDQVPFGPTLEDEFLEPFVARYPDVDGLVQRANADRYDLIYELSWLGDAVLQCVSEACLEDLVPHLEATATAVRRYLGREARVFAQMQRRGLGFLL